MKTITYELLDGSLETITLTKDEFDELVAKWREGELFTYVEGEEVVLVDTSAITRISYDDEQEED